MSINNRSINIPKQNIMNKNIQVQHFIPRFMRWNAKETWDKSHINMLGMEKAYEISKRNLTNRLANDLFNNLELIEIEDNTRDNIIFGASIEILTEKIEAGTSNKDKILNLIIQLRNNPHNFNTAKLADEVIKEIKDDEILIG